jgi:hypothetical protein
MAEHVPDTEAQQVDPLQGMGNASIRPSTHHQGPEQRSTYYSDTRNAKAHRYWVGLKRTSSRISKA